MKQRTSIGGFLDIGLVRIPPLPQFMGLTDRDDGTVWVLTHNGEDFYITDEVTFTTRRRDIRVFGPYDGPWLTDDIRLFARARSIGYEVILPPASVTARSDGRILSRRSKESFTREIVVPEGWTPNHGLAHNGIDF